MGHLQGNKVSSMRIPARGPGRPRKWKSPLIQWRADIPLEDFEFAEEERTKLGLSRAEFFHALLHHTNWSVVELHSENKKKDERIKELEKENSELKRLVERLQRENEKLRLENEALKQGRSVRTYEEGKLLRTLAEHAREGISWADLCAEVLDLRDEKKMRHLMKLAFNVKKADRDTYERVFYPKRTSPEFQKWVLVRPNRDGPVLLIDYELWPRDVYEAAEASKKAKAEAKANMVKRLKRGKAAERFIEMTFESIYRNYMEFIRARQGKRAKEYLEETVPAILVEKVFPEIAPEEVRKAVLAVLQRREGDWNEAFVSNLRRVVLRALKESQVAVLEVKADV